MFRRYRLSIKVILLFRFLKLDFTHFQENLMIFFIFRSWIFIINLNLRYFIYFIFHKTGIYFQVYYILMGDLCKYYLFLLFCTHFSESFFLWLIFQLFCAFTWTTILCCRIHATLGAGHKGSSRGSFSSVYNSYFYVCPRIPVTKTFKNIHTVNKRERGGNDSPEWVIE